MESTTDKNDSNAAVLAPSQKDAIPIAQDAAETNTPVAKKTRRATRKRMDSRLEESPPIPGTPASRTQDSETPRRSCRKSVRPPIDYEDIVRSAKKLIHDAEDVGEGEQEPEPGAQKWNVAEVGKISRKRGRKSKRVTSKKPKTEQHEPQNAGTDSEVKSAEQPEDQLEQPEEKLEETEKKLDQSVVKEIQPEEKLEEPEKKLDQSVVKEMQPEEKLEEPEKKLDQSVVKEIQPEEKLEEPEKKLDQSMVKPEVMVQPENTEVQPEVHNESQKPEQAVAVVEDVVEEAERPDSNSKIKAASRRGSRAAKKQETRAAGSLKKQRKQFKHIVADEDIEELGLAPLNDEIMTEQTVSLALEEDKSTEKQETLAESAKVSKQVDQQEEMPLQELDKSLPEEEMASLIMLDDDEAEKPALNTTFDADDITKEDQSVILVDTPHSEAHKPKIKVVLTTAEDKNETLLNLEHASPKGYRFPTPFITKKSFKFSDPPEPSTKLEPESRCGRRRSKSTSQLNDTMPRTVTFQDTPVEIVSVDDMDQRWKAGTRLNNVTTRRKRSKSLEERSCLTSRIPKPKCQLLLKPKPVTPSQVKKRTKLPDFTAIHQKQFAKMESLIDHMERKAERAKVLTTSAVKKPPGSTAKKAQSSTSVAARAEGARPKALKKINMPIERQVAVENPEKKLAPSRLPLKSALNVTAAAPRPAFNLSTTTVKTFNATFSSKPAAESQKDKLAQRRQRHMDMFKGRTAAKTQGGKSEIIRGVRSNRRFELQMQHRRHLEED